MKFPKLSLIDKLRYGAMMFLSTKRSDWRSLENVSAKDWITSWCGRGVYERLWAPLFELKFYEYADNISAAWIWTRIKRVGTSRRSMMQEELGYIEGGSETLVHALVKAIEESGGAVVLGAPASHVEVASRARHRRHRRRHDLSGRCGDLDGADAAGGPSGAGFAGGRRRPLSRRSQYRRRLRRVPPQALESRRISGSISPIRGSRFPASSSSRICARPATRWSTFPITCRSTHPKFAMDDAYFRDEGFGYLKLFNPQLRDDDLIACHVGRLRHAQPVCPPGFLAMLPPVETAIGGLQIADTCFYYPEDRGISESVRFGKLMAERVA